MRLSFVVFPGVFVGTYRLTLEEERAAPSTEISALFQFLLQNTALKRDRPYRRGWAGRVAQRQPDPQQTQKHDFSRRVVKKLSAAAERALIEYDWPGNVRELRNVIERAIILSGNDGTIRLPHVTLSDASPARGAVTLTFEREVKLEDVKRAYVEAMHRKYSGHRSRLARALGVSERNLYRLLLKYGLE
jgi:hypothetical protein